MTRNVEMRDLLLYEAAVKDGEALAAAVLAYDASLTEWGKTAALGQLGSFAQRQAKDLLDHSYRDMKQLAQELLEEG